MLPRIKLKVRRADAPSTPIPTNLHEYQTKGLTKIAIRNGLILKDAILVVGGLARAEIADLKRKAGTSSRTQT
jgi:hypothetical protein